jgi:hypothetical protein
MIMQELAKMVGEDALVQPGGKDTYRDTGYNPRARSPHNLTLSKHSDSYDDFGGGEEGTCEQCGGMTYEDQCMEADCGSVYEEMDIDYDPYQGDMGLIRPASRLDEGDCGCNGSSSDGTDYSIDTMGMVGDALGVLTHTGYDVDATKGGHRNHNNYMAKPSLYKVAKYAQKLLHMIPDGYELDDWQRHKIAQISDDISEVYHSLDYDFHETED